MRQLITRYSSLSAAWRSEKVIGSPSRFTRRGYVTSKTPFADITIPVPWGSISGKWWGAVDLQPILAVHGWEDNAGSFDELAPLLVSGNNSVLAIDLPGHGLSSHCPMGMTYNFMDGVILIRQLAKYFKWDKFSILGHSYGSKVAFTFAAFFPENVENLIGIDCVRAEITQKESDVIYHLRTTTDSTLYLEEKMSQGRPPAYNMEEMIHLMQNGSRGPMSRKSCEIILKRGAKESHVQGKYCFSRDPRLKTLPFGRLSEEMLIVCASRISCNVLQIVAKPGWGIGGSEMHRKTVQLMEKGAKKFEERILEGTHHIHLDTPEKVAVIVKNFIV